MPRDKALSFSAFSVLYAITHGHRYGFDIMDAAKLPSGTVYPLLSRLEADGLLRSSWEDAAVARAEKRPPRKYYEVTSAGAEALAASLSVLRGIDGAGGPAGAPVS